MSAVVLTWSWLLAVPHDSMSIPSDLLTAAKPSRLLCRRGTWVLELVKLVALERNVFQPRVERLEGSEAVLHYLKRSVDDPALATAAGQLIRGLRPDQDRYFEAIDGEWVPSEPGAARESTRPSGAPPGSKAANELAELRAEVLLLRVSHERMRERVVRLESLISSGSQPPREPTFAPAAPVLSFAHSLQASPPEAPIVPSAEDKAVPNPSAKSSAVPHREVSPARSSSSPRAASTLKLPSVSAVNACLTAAVGAAVRLRERQSVSFAPSATDLYWVCRLIDEEGGEIGAIVSDLGATTSLGGRLVGLSEAEIEAQRSARVASADVLGAMSEVANNISGSINQEQTTKRVRVKPIEALTEGQLDWVKTASQALELEVDTTGGRLFLFVR